MTLSTLALSSPSFANCHHRFQRRRSFFITQRPSLQGLTIIEVVCVLAIIAVLISIFWTRLNDRTIGLEAAQRSVAALLTAARGQARIHFISTRMVIDNDPESEGYLRRAWVVRRAGEISGGGDAVPSWESTGNGTTFRRGIHLVPPGDDVHEEMFANYRDPGKRKSNGRRERVFIDGVERSVISYGFTPRGRRSGIAATARIVIGPSRISPAGPVFENSDRILGMHLREYGTITFVNVPAGFD